MEQKQMNRAVLLSAIVKHHLLSSVCMINMHFEFYVLQYFDIFPHQSDNETLDELALLQDFLYIIML